jgi:putative PIN family toxin of toxin-antitoxin system
VRVFLDTNVLASALATRGLCTDVLREVLAQHVLLISNEVRAELARALLDKFGIPKRIARELDLFLEREAVTVPAAKPAGKGIRDEADRSILGSALAGQADLFITGDKELQQAGRIASMRIVSPRQFWQLLRR